MFEKLFFKTALNYLNDSNLVQSLFVQISGEYNLSERYYHNLRHIEQMLEKLCFFQNEVANFDNLLFAIIYHDVIYNPKRNDNEEKSAVMAIEHLKLMNYSPQNILEVQSLILSTKKHQAFSNQFDTKLLLDLDLLILGSSETVYFSYADNIRKEYSFVPLFLYRKKRKEVLESFLENERIYLLDYFFYKYEKQARINIENEIIRFG